MVAFAVVAALVAIPGCSQGGGSSRSNRTRSASWTRIRRGHATVELEGPPGVHCIFRGRRVGDQPRRRHRHADRSDEQEIRDSIPVERTRRDRRRVRRVWVVNSGERSVSRISPRRTRWLKRSRSGTARRASRRRGCRVGDQPVRRDDLAHRPRHGEVEIPVGLDPRGIAIGFGSVWVALAGSNQVVRIDPTTNDVTAPIGVGNAPDSLAVSRGRRVVANTLDDTVMEIGPDTNKVVGTIEVGTARRVAVVQGTVWVANEWDGTLSRIEPGQGRPAHGDRERPARARGCGRRPLGLGPRGRHNSSHRGGTLRWSRDDPPISLDPGNSYFYAVASAAPDRGWSGRFEPTGGDPVPDLATDIPTPTDGGLTYTFQLRRGSDTRTARSWRPPTSSMRSSEVGGFNRAITRTSTVGSWGRRRGSDPDTCDLPKAS